MAGILEGAKPVAIIGTRGHASAKSFYTDVLGLKFRSEDQFAAVFEIGGAMMRLSSVPDFKPHDHTAFGFDVKDIEASVKALAAKGVTFNIYEGFGQDALGIWTAPGGAARVAWFKDTDGNVLNLTQF